MLRALQSVLDAIQLFLSNSEVRSNVVRPALRAALWYVASFFFMLFVSVGYVWNLDTGASWLSLLIQIIGSILIILVVPVVISFLYFSFFCDKYYQAIADKVLSDVRSDVVKLHREEKVISKTLKIAILAPLLILLILISFFVPYLSLILGALLFSADTMSHCGTYLKISYYQQGRLLVGNFLPVVCIGLMGILVSAFPFAFILVYPFGVLSGAFLLRRIIATRQS